MSSSVLRPRHLAFSLMSPISSRLRFCGLNHFVLLQLFQFPDSIGLQSSSTQCGSPIPTPCSSPILIIHRPFRIAVFKAMFNLLIWTILSLVTAIRFWHVLGSQCSFLTYHFQLSSSQPPNHYASEYHGMLGSQPLSEVSFVGPFSTAPSATGL